MKKSILLIICVCSLFTAQAQKKAVTELGEEVILYQDGTYEYVDEKEMVKGEIPINPEEFFKDDKSTFLIKSSKANFGFWLDPKKWSFKKSVTNPAAEYELMLKNGDMYGMIITEKIEIPIVTLRSIALENAKTVAPDINIVKQEYRIVNGSKVLLIQMEGAAQGIKFTYNGYYFSNSSGTVQFITYTAQNLFSEYKDVSEELLNGFTEIK